MTSKRTCWLAGLAIGTAFGTLAPSQSGAQPPGDRGHWHDGDHPGGPGGPRGGMRNRPKGQIERMIGGVGRLNRDNKTALTKSQSRKFMALVTPWRKQSHMTDAQATALYARLSNVLTASQKQELERRPPMNGDPGGNGSGPGGGPGGAWHPNGRGPGGDDGDGADHHHGGRGGDGDWGNRPGRDGGPGGFGDRPRPTPAQMQQMRSFMDSYNPLYIGTYAQVKQLPDRMQQDFTRRRQRQWQVLAQLNSKAK